MQSVATSPSLTADDLKDLGITAVGHRRQLLDAIAALRDYAPAARPPQQPLWTMFLRPPVNAPPNAASSP